MLRVLDGVEMTKLIDYGFKPKYNEDTGALDRFVKVYHYDNDTYYDTYYIVIDAQTEYCDPDDYYNSIKSNPMYKIVKIDFSKSGGKPRPILIERIMDDIYLLTKAGIIGGEIECYE